MRFGLIGAGGMGRYQAEMLSRVPGAELAAIADPAPTPAAARLAERVGAELLATPEALLARPDVDAVIVASPTDTHAPLSIQAARAGKHVFCEKPIARTVSEGEAMIAEAERAGVRLAVGHVVRYFPDYAAARDMVRAGVVGTPGVARASRLNSMPHASSWYADTARSGGVVLDLMIHDLDWMRWTFGEAERLHALGLTYAGAPGKDAAMVVIRFRGGAIGYVEASWSHARFSTSFEVSGSGGLIRGDSDSGATQAYHLAGGAPEAGSRWAEGLEESPYAAQLREVADWMAGGPAPRHTAEDGLAALRLGEAALASMRDGRPVSFD